MGVATQIPIDTFDDIQTDAGILLKKFDISKPNDVENADIITATTGGFTVSVKPTYSDMGSDVDNCPENTAELKHLDSWAITISFTAISTSSDTVKLSLGASDIDIETGKISPRKNLKQSDFIDSLYWIGDKSDGGLVVVNAHNILSTDGLSLKTTKNGKGQLSITLTCHVSLKSQDVVPIDFYVLEGEDDVETQELEDDVETQGEG